MYVTKKKERRETMSTCIVTLHGIGFQSAPIEGINNSGYADALHHHLYRAKGMSALLSDDPKRTHPQPGDNGAIYVESRWRMGGNGPASHEEGLKRLGTWSEDGRSVIKDDAPLYSAGKSVAHIALVYSNLEPRGDDVGAAFITAAMALLGAASYVSIRGEGQLLKDVTALFGKRGTSLPDDQLPLSSTPRQDLTTSHKKVQPAQIGPQPSFMSSLVNDVACYVCYNEERERVRSFVREALTRLAYRDDVDKIILNTHSNGTVIAFDVLRHLSVETTNKIQAFVTAGSPLRKYVDLFDWGNQIQCPYQVKPWYNFYDPYDLVADLLDPPKKWHLGNTVELTNTKLFSRIDLNSEVPSYIDVCDLPVNNVKNSRGTGLIAHNYWDNKVDFVPQLSQIVSAIVADKPIVEYKDRIAV